MPVTYRFGRFELRANERLVYADGEALPLGSRAVDVLLSLLRRHGRLVSKADLLDEAWPGLVVEENNLQVQISTLRKCLGAQAIATVPGRGYRLMLQVEEGAAAVGRASSGEPPSSEGGSEAAAPADRLPMMAGSLWGRDADQAVVAALPAGPLLTITGPAGVGKTAFALQLAHHWATDHSDGAAWVDLAAVKDGAWVARAIAQAVGVSLLEGEPLQALVNGLRSQQLLIVLDNAEHLVTDVAQVAHALNATAPGVRLLVTSQCPLKVSGERVFALAPLSVPGQVASLDEAMQHGAFALFIEQVRALDRRFSANEAQVPMIAELCRRLDGLPLAIKLAAARVPLLGVQGVSSRLDERLRLLAAPGHAAPERQQALAAALDWSHALLSPLEQTVFRRLSVFVGSFSVDMVQGLAFESVIEDEWGALECLSSLVDRSLVMVDESDPPRYRLLESMRVYAWRCLSQAQEVAAVRERHAALMAEHMEQAYEAFWHMADADWLARYTPDLDNVRLALEWCPAHDSLRGLQLLGSSAPLFMLLGLAPEWRWRSQVLEPLALAQPQAAPVPRYWLERSRLCWGVSQQSMHDFARRAVDGYRAVGHAQGQFLALRCLIASGLATLEQAQTWRDELCALERADWPARLRAQSLLAQAAVHRHAGDLVAARHAGEDLIMLAEAHGLDGMRSAALHELAGICLSLNDGAAAWQACQRIIDHGHHRRDNFVLHALALQGIIRLQERNWRAARALLQEFLLLSKARGWEWLDLYGGALALLAAAESRPEDAARLLGHAQHSRARLGPLDPLVQRVEQIAHDLVFAALPAPVMRQLMAQGGSLMPETVVAWALSSVPPSLSASEAATAGAP